MSKYKCMICKELFTDNHICKPIPNPKNYKYKCFNCGNYFNEPRKVIIGYKGFLGQIRSIWDKSLKIYLESCPNCRQHNFGSIDFINKQLEKNNQKLEIKLKTE